MANIFKNEITVNNHFKETNWSYIVDIFYKAHQTMQMWFMCKQSGILLAHLDNL